MKVKMKSAVMALMLLASGCSSGLSDFCANDRQILPLPNDIERMSGELVMRIDAHDQHFEEFCR